MVDLLNLLAQRLSLVLQDRQLILPGSGRGRLMTCKVAF